MGAERWQRMMVRWAAGLVVGSAWALAVGSAEANAQDGPTLGQDIPIAIAIPPELEEFGPSVRTQLESRLAQFATASGMAAVDGMANIVMYPLLVVTDERRTGGLIEDVGVVRLEISLYVKNVLDGAVFASTSREVMGSGGTREAALRNGIRQLSGRDATIRDFTRDARMKIVEYYERSCDQTLREARTWASAGDVGEALALLLAVPGEAASCHERANEEAVTLFDAHEAELCTGQVRRAEAEMAVDHFTESIDALIGVSDTGPCGQRADELIASIEAEVGGRAEASFQAQLERYRAFTDTIGSGVEAEGQAAADRVRTLTRAKIVVWRKLNDPAARSIPPEFFQTNRSG
jgi:hypothetical protein